MFMFPEPPPLDYYLADIEQSFVADGIFYHEKPPATHKFVAKQLKPIERRASDPVAPAQQLDSRTLDRHLVKAKEFYVPDPGKDDGVIFQTLSIMPKRKRDDHGWQKSTYSIFPRSRQYESCYIRKRRAEDFAKRGITGVECRKEKEETAVTDNEPCGVMKAPIWWKDKTGKPRNLPLGNINDYAYEKLTDLSGDVKISERLGMDHPSKYIPGVIHRLTNPEDRSMQETLERADAFKIVLKTDEMSVEKPPVDQPVCSEERQETAITCHGTKAKSREAIDFHDATIHARDKRWQPPVEASEFPKNDAQRNEELRRLTKPFLHDLHTWYAINKATELIAPIRHVGKKAIPERHFSHL